MNKITYSMGLAATIFLSIVAVNQAVAQNFDPLRYTPDISEDQVIVCVQDVSDSEFRDQVYCKYYQADADHKRTIQNIQEDLYKHPFEDTFEMGLID